MTKGRHSKLYKGIGIGLGVVLVLGGAAYFAVLPRLGGDAEVLNDIDQHFEALEQIAPDPDEKRVAVDVPRPQSVKTPPKSHFPRSPTAERQRPTPKRRAQRTTRTRSRQRTAEPKPEPRWEGIQQVAAGTYLLDPTLVSDAQKRPQKYIRGARAELEEQNGQPIGYRLTGIRKGSPLHAAGFRNGDVLTNVNGHKLTSADEAILAAAALKFADKYRVDLLRRDKRRYLYYRVAAD